MALKMQNGRYFNEDGNDNELTADVAGWLNYFLNGVNVVHGSGLSDEPGTGTYSNCFAIARNETFSPTQKVCGSNDQLLRIHLQR